MIAPHMRATNSQTPAQGAPVAMVPIASDEALANGVYRRIGGALQDVERLQMGGEGMGRVRQASVRQRVRHQDMSELVDDPRDRGGTQGSTARRSTRGSSAATPMTRIARLAA